MAPKVGFEPTTDRLTADCSTTELLRNGDNDTFIQYNKYYNHFLKFYKGIFKIFSIFKVINDNETNSTKITSHLF